MSTKAPGPAVIHDIGFVSDQDVYLFNEGTNFRLYHRLGAHVIEHEGRRGTHFAVWAPNAERVGLVGDFNGWDEHGYELRTREGSGIWTGFVPGVGEGAHYKYRVHSRYHMYRADKADPFAVRSEVPPKTASIVHTLDYEWSDGEWMRTRGDRQRFDRPISVYEMHVGSWMRSPDAPEAFLGYGILAERLADHLERHGFTHVELLPVNEHPLYRSWGYQTTGYFAPTSRYGPPEALMGLIDVLHQRGIGVLIDWVPSHFPSDEHGLGYFDGTHLFEHADPRKGFHPDWKSLIFNYGRHEVRAFLLSSAIAWLDRYHIDGIRVDAVASMLYLDYSRDEGQWIPNRHGGRENIEAIEFLQQFNRDVHREYPGVLTIAEESTSWPMVSRPTDIGGLGFDYKWDMGWMHDTLQYAQRDPIYRRHHHNQLTFRAMYQFSENFMLPLSHDEVVHGKGSIVSKMPGDEWQRFANLRLVYAYQWAQPGKKLLFMGSEFGQTSEWDHDRSLDWHLLEHPPHEGVARLIADLNRLYRAEIALHERDCHPSGFEWIDADDADNSVLTFLRRGERAEDVIACAFNFTPVPRGPYRIGLPMGGRWTEVLNTDAEQYWGSGIGNMGSIEALPVPWGRYRHSSSITIPPLGAVFLKYDPPTDV